MREDSEAYTDRWRYLEPKTLASKPGSIWVTDFPFSCLFRYFRRCYICFSKSQQIVSILCLFFRFFVSFPFSPSSPPKHDRVYSVAISSPEVCISDVITRRNARAAKVPITCIWQPSSALHCYIPLSLALRHSSSNR